MPEMTGTVIIVQEGRLQLLDTQGAAHLFILSHSAAADTSQLRALQSGQAKVRIRYSTVPNLIALKAEAIQLLDETARA